MHEKTKDYLPALRFEFLTRFYDPLVRVTTREYTLKRALIAQANLENGQTILDLGCGTGIFDIGIKHRFSDCKTRGFNVDEEILQMAREKAEKNNLEIICGQGYSDDLPFENEQFERAEYFKTFIGTIRLFRAVKI